MNTRERMSEALMEASGIPGPLSKKIVDGAINICWGLGTGILTSGVFSASAAPLVVGGTLGGLAALQVYRGNFKLKPFAAAAALVCGFVTASFSPFTKTPDADAVPPPPLKISIPQRAVITTNNPIPLAPR